MKQRKIAIPVDDNGMLDGHFGHCKFFSLVQTEGNKVLASVKVQPPPHEPGVLPAWLAQQGVSDVIAGGMGQRAIELFQAAGVNVFVGAPCLEADALIEQFLKEELTLTANYCDH